MLFLFFDNISIYLLLIFLNQIIIFLVFVQRGISYWSRLERKDEGAGKRNL